MEIRSSYRRSGFVAVMVCMLGMLANADFAQAQDLSGNWTGRWQSSTNNHGGRMNARFTQQCGNELRVKFTGRFKKVIPFRYRANLQIIHQEPGLTIVGGSKKIGPLMGDYSYYGQITDCCFTGTYSSRRYKGSWAISKTY